MSVESSLELLKEEIVGLHHRIADETQDDKAILTLELTQKMQEYELLSAEYNDLFKAILEESSKMKDDYAGSKRNTN